MKFVAADLVSLVKVWGPARDSLFGQLASSRVAGAACPWASSTTRVCLVPTCCFAAVQGHIVGDEEIRSCQQGQLSNAEPRR
jgi:hypothetical protein